MFHAVRWLLVLPTAVVAWFVALFVGVGAYVGVEALCPANQITSGQCVAPWFVTAQYGAVTFGAAIAATFIMLAHAWK